jgi:hypothetical protein
MEVTVLASTTTSTRAFEKQTEKSSVLQVQGLSKCQKHYLVQFQVQGRSKQQYWLVLLQVTGRS